MATQSSLIVPGGIVLLSGSYSDPTWITSLSDSKIKPFVSVISTNTNAVVGYTYIVTASLTLTLPASPVSGDRITISNRSGAVTCVVARNGNRIMSLTEDMTIDLTNAAFSLVYSNATLGWTIF